MQQVLLRAGEAVVEEVPAPQVSDNNLLVAVEYSCISVGTEMASLNMSALPLYRRAMKQPENVKKVLTLVKTEGIQRTMKRVRGQLAAGNPSGYSAAGRVLEVGANVVGFEPGDLVACAGAGIANHAEIINVPVNLAVKVPDGVGTDAASTVTVGAIALQGVRRASPTLGESFVVVGLGLLGLITVQLLRANGCKVIGVDPDAARRELAEKLGAQATLDPMGDRYPARVQQVTDGFGADAVIITAASPSDEIVSQAFQATRKKGRVVLVGDVGLNIKRADIYTKEIDFFISCSYGPGRYDPSYEEGGRDYPLAYARWTENRNMQAYLELIAAGRMDTKALVQATFPLENAGSAYAALNAPTKPLAVLLQYARNDAAPVRRVNLRTTPKRDGQIRVGLIGASSFAQAIHLPNMAKLGSEFRLRGVMSRTGSNANATAKLYESDYATTDAEEILKDKDIDLVLIATRHDLHGPLTLRALEAGKHVFVEKPLAIRADELQAIEDYYKTERSQVLLTGFNRRFAPALTRVKAFLAGRTSPLIVNYQMNAGYAPPDSWLHGGEGGGRNIGEACHIYDLFNFLTGAKVTKVTASSIVPASKHWQRNDNFVATVSFDDGSVCTLTYTALGAADYPKERMQVFAGGAVAYMDDFKSLRFFGRKGASWDASLADKGQMDELKALSACLRKGGAWPISLADQIAATRVSFDVERQVNNLEVQPA